MKQGFQDRLALLMPGALLVRWSRAYTQPLVALKACPRADWLPWLALAGGFSLPSITRAVCRALQPRVEALPGEARAACQGLLQAVEAWCGGTPGADHQVMLNASNVLAVMLPMRGAPRLLVQAVHLLELVVGDAAQGSATAVGHLASAVRFVCLSDAMEATPSLDEVAPVTLAHAVEVHFSRSLPPASVPPPLPRPRGLPVDVEQAQLKAVLDALAAWCPAVLEPLLAA